MSVIDYRPPPIANAFLQKYAPGELFETWIVGPFGSAKTTACFFKLAYMATLQEPSPAEFSGGQPTRYTRCVVVRNTGPQLNDSTLQSWDYWFKDGQAGKWIASEKTFVLKFNDVECEVLFRALDTAADVQRVLGLEVTFAILDEFRELPKPVVEGITGRLGRYKPPGGVKVTNWGIWGASNPGTEDLWWYDYLHGSVDAETGGHVGCIQVKFPLDPQMQATFEQTKGYPADCLSWYFCQPSGLAPNAENIENLPGGVKYYENLAKGRSQAWIKQYVEAEWGFSADGLPVIPSFRTERHVARRELIFNPWLRLIVAVDPGLGGSALIFMQLGLDGRLYVLGELVQKGYGARRLISQRLKPYIANRFPNARVLIVPDPAAGNRSSNDEKAIVETFREAFGRENVTIETNNRLPLRINAIDHFCTQTTEDGYALQIDPVHCPALIRALKGGWRWKVDAKKDDVGGAEPEKNAWSHPGDAFGYGCRYFHKGMVRSERMGGTRLPRQDYSGNPYRT